MAGGAKRNHSARQRSMPGATTQDKERGEWVFLLMWETESLIGPARNQKTHKKPLDNPQPPLLSPQSAPRQHPAAGR